MSDTTSTDRPDLGPNEGMVDEMFRLFQDDPEAVPESWREFFADYKLGGTPINAQVTPAVAGDFVFAFKGHTISL